MAEQVDARGLSCPVPVIATRKKMAELGKGTFEVLVDTDTAKENISRMAGNEGWEIEILNEKTGCRLVLKKK